MTTLFVNSMSCGSCARHITHAVKTLDPDAQLTIDLPARKVSIASSKSTEELVNAVKALDYEVSVVEE
ncbi:heavy-metal-associated domain-containing protein [Cellvibrio sp. QJXJ]|uniref:heavy-metal-associated domain-containing protein n=1 Tax=Cellvibrio sp. QJXJ TaxID=2964606 RepID=UPI0021C2989C|nr:heavy-metal-associated domain-containing protein [Cellvibrio sp. QJXJ]UUA74955.1 heavy-metal-associated domain-containing protein [Cellvibrio sp. QJXJ]